MKFSLGRIAALSATLALCSSALCSSAVADPEVDKGKAIYDGAGACSTCHGPGGAGDGPVAATLNPKPRDFTKGEFLWDTDGDGKKGTEADIASVIANGGSKYGGSMMMTARPDISEADRKALAKYVLSLKKK